MVQVTLLDTMELATFCVRTFSLHKVNASAVLPLTHRSVAVGRARISVKQSSGDLSEPDDLFKLGQPPCVRRRDSIAAPSEALSYSMRLI